MAVGDKNAGTGDPELRLAVGESLKVFKVSKPPPLYNMAEAAKRSAVANRNENRKEGKESDKEKDANNNRTEDVR